VGELAAAVLSTDCPGTLRDLDPDWVRVPGCEEPDEDGFGCSASAGDADAASVGILLALVAVLVRRGR
jgi:MYXO-CTERM domain-containing protein